MAEIRPYRPDDLEAVFALATEVFVAGSTLHKAMGFRLVEYRAYLRPAFCEMVEQGLSVVAVNEGGVFQGCMIAVDFHGPVHERPNAHPVFGPLSKLTSVLCAQYRRYRDISSGEVMFDAFAVEDAYPFRGISEPPSIILAEGEL